jgi:GNAT superfamily N-acetyltransferase
VIAVRDLEEKDLPAVVDLLCQLAEHAGGGQVDPRRVDARRIFALMRGAPEVYANWIAESDGRVVGFLSVVFYCTLFHPGGTALINELVVDRGARGQGVGGLLVRRAEQEAIRRGMDELEVGTERANAAALRFYRTRGFGEEYILLGKECAPSGRAGKESAAGHRPQGEGEQ